MPLFSIIIPVYNRARLIGRAIDSCLNQGAEDCEVIVVDDGSSDNTLSVVRSYQDGRIKVVEHQANKGQCAAKNTGSRMAAGEWLIFLDSDDELVPGALDIVRNTVMKQGSAADKLFFMCRWSNGILSPDPPLKGEIWDYEGFVRWLESMIGFPIECLLCVKRTSFLQVPFPEGHRPEGRHNLDFSKTFRAMGCSDVLRVYHQNSHNRLMRPSVGNLLRYSPGYADEIDKTFEDHGVALKKWAPNLRLAYQQVGALFHFLNGNRKIGFKYIASYISAKPLSVKGWIILIFGFLGPWPLALMKTSYDTVAISSNLLKVRGPAVRSANPATGK